jgi:hypothetical protein
LLIYIVSPKYGYRLYVRALLSFLLLPILARKKLAAAEFKVEGAEVEVELPI